MGKFVDFYCKNELQELKKIVDKIINNKFGWMPQMYYDDIYSIAASVVWNCEKRFDEARGVKFKTLLIGCLERKIKTYVTGMNRNKRTAKDNEGNTINNVSIEDAMNSYNEALTNMCVDDIFNDSYYNRSAYTYMNSLTKRQKLIVGLRLQGYSPTEIKKALGITDAQYALACNRMRTFKKQTMLHVDIV